MCIICMDGTAPCALVVVVVVELSVKMIEIYQSNHSIPTIPLFPQPSILHHSNP